MLVTICLNGLYIQVRHCKVWTCVARSCIYFQSAKWLYSERNHPQFLRPRIFNKWHILFFCWYLLASISTSNHIKTIRCAMWVHRRLFVDIEIGICILCLAVRDLYRQTVIAFYFVLHMVRHACIEIASMANSVLFPHISYA